MMAGDRQKTTMRRNLPVGWQMQFAALGWANKVTCIICGTQGYPGTSQPQGWQLSCLLGHPDQCETCGARFVKGGLSKHLTCKVHHRCCVAHIDTQHRRLARLLA